MPGLKCQVQPIEHRHRQSATDPPRIGETNLCTKSLSCFVHSHVLIWKSGDTRSLTVRIISWNPILVNGE